jgi:hypothetical protein
MVVGVLRAWIVESLHHLPHGYVCEFVLRNELLVFLYKFLRQVLRVSISYQSVPPSSEPFMYSTSILRSTSSTAIIFPSRGFPSSNVPATESPISKQLISSSHLLPFFDPTCVASFYIVTVIINIIPILPVKFLGRTSPILCDMMPPAAGGHAHRITDSVADGTRSLSSIRRDDLSVIIFR